jgi:hypothetical protein
MPRNPSRPPPTAPKKRFHPLLQRTLTPASMIADGSSVRPAIAGFLSAKRAKLHKHGHNIAPSAVLHHHQLPQLPLQSRGPPFYLYRHFETICDLQCAYIYSHIFHHHTAFRHHHSISSHWFQRSHPQHREPPRKRKRIVPHQAHLLQLSRLPRHNHLQRHHSQTNRRLHLPPTPPAASLVDEMQSSAPHCYAQTRCWHRWSPTVCSAHFAASGFSFGKTVRSVRTHGSSTAVNVSSDSQSLSVFFCA